MTVLRSLSPYFDPTSRVAESFSESCRQLSSVAACAPCHPDVGTGRKVGLCPSLCTSLYSACSEGLFTSLSAEGELKPCTDASLLCSPLREIVGSGEEMCRRMGLGLGAISRADAHAHSFGEEVQRMVRDADGADADASALDQDDDELACFDGSALSGRTAYSAADADAAAAADGSDGADSPRKRYYKTAEEVAELERKRAARAARAQQRASEDISLLALATSFLRWFGREVVTPLRAEFGRFLRRIPFMPRAWIRALEGSDLALAGMILLVQAAVWSAVRPVLVKVTDALCRRRGQGAREYMDEVPASTGSVGPRGPSLFRGPVSASGLSTDELRRRRAAKLQQRLEQQMQQQEREAEQELAETNTAANESATPAKPREVTIVDGEVVQLDE